MILAAMMVPLGALAGAFQAVALWRAAHRPHRSAWTIAWRLPVVVAVLVSAALAGGLMPAAGGWAGGLAGTSALLLMRRAR